MLRTFLIACVILAVASASADARRRHHRQLRDIEAPLDEPSKFSDPRRVLPSQAEANDLNKTVPSGWQLQPADPNWHGRRYISPIGDAWMAMYESPAAEEPAAQHLKAVAFVEGEEITYLRGERNWLVVSGLKDNRVFYRVVALTCDKKTWEHVAFEYPPEKQRVFEGLVARSARVLYQKCDPSIE